MNLITRTVIAAIIVVALAGCGWLGAGPEPIAVEVSGISLSEGTLDPAFDAAVTDYAATVPYATDGITVTVTAADTALSANVNDTAVLPGDGSATVNLAVGENTITVVVSLENDSQTYTVVVTRAEPPQLQITGKLNESDTSDSVIANGATIDFGIVYGQGSWVEIEFTIENLGSGPLILEGTEPAFVTLSGTHADFYSVPTQPSRDSIPPGETEVFVIRFTTQAGSNGTKEAEADLFSNDPDNGTFTLSLTGEASST